jgi:DNA modification methylase
MTTKEYRKLDQLKLNEDNPRGIKKHDFERLKKQVQKLGMYKPILITPEGKVLGGNMRIRVYQDLGIDDIWVSVVNPKNETEEMEYILSDNDRAGYWEEQDLAELITNLPELELETYAIDMGEPKGLDEFMRDFSPEEIIEDEVPEVSDDPVSRLGEVYQLGKHRLMCGDSTKIEDVEKLMNGQKADMVFTDPPYGIDYQDTKGNFEKIKGDSTNPIELIRDSLSLHSSAPAYVCCNWKSMQNVIDAMEQSALSVKACIVWDKGTRIQNLDKYYKQHEFILYSGAFGGEKTVDGDVWQISRETREDHPTAKPVELCARAIRHETGTNVIDLFGGSGSTLIACEQLNRTCFMMELDPKYVDVIRKRYAKFIGKEDEWEKNSPQVK